MKAPWKCDHEHVADGATRLVCLDCDAFWRWNVRAHVGRWVYLDKKGNARFANNPGITDPTHISPSERIEGSPCP